MSDSYALDLETVPAPDVLKHAQETSVAQLMEEGVLEVKYGNTKDAGKLAEIERKARLVYIKDLALNVWNAHICAAAVANDEIQEKYWVSDTVIEAQIVEKLFQFVSPENQIITFNGQNYDIRVLYIRAMRLGVKPKCPIGMFLERYKTLRHLDLRMQLGNWDKYAKGSLDMYCRDILGESKPDYDPTEFPQMLAEGKGEEISEHCLAHTVLTWQLAQATRHWFW